MPYLQTEIEGLPVVGHMVSRHLRELPPIVKMEIAKHGHELKELGVIQVQHFNPQPGGYASDEFYLQFLMNDKGVTNRQAIDTHIHEIAADSKAAKAAVVPDGVTKIDLPPSGGFFKRLFAREQPYRPSHPSTFVMLSYGIHSSF